MARKKRFGGFKRRAIRTYSSVKRRYGRRSSGGSAQLIQLPAMAYGALRNPAANMIMPVTHGVTGMLGQYEDEAVMLASSWALARFGGGFLREIGQKGLTVENANIGATLTQGLSLGGGSSGSAW